jgi:hypothetical protein
MSNCQDITTNIRVLVGHAKFVEKVISGCVGEAGGMIISVRVKYFYSNIYELGKP